MTEVERDLDLLVADLLTEINTLKITQVELQKKWEARYMLLVADRDKYLRLYRDRDALLDDFK